MQDASKARARKSQDDASVRLEKIVGAPASVALRWRLSPASRRWKFGPCEGAMVAWRVKRDWSWIDDLGERRPASRLAVAGEIAEMLRAELGERRARLYPILGLAKAAVVRLER